VRSVVGTGRKKAKYRLDSASLAKFGSTLASIADSAEVEFADLHAELRANQGSNKSGATSGWTGTAKGKDFDSAAGQPNDIACKGQPDLLSRLGSPQDCIRTEIDGCVGRIES
jgi:hypothetical protein